MIHCEEIAFIDHHQDWSGKAKKPFELFKDPKLDAIKALKDLMDSLNAWLEQVCEENPEDCTDL